MKVFLWILVACLTVAAGVCGAGWWLSAHGASAAEAAVRVKLEPPVRGDLVEFVSGPGQTEPYATVSLRLPVAGQVTGLPVKVGDTVSGGDDASVVLEWKALDAGAVQTGRAVGRTRTLAAPIDGVVTAVNAEVGDVIAANLPGALSRMGAATAVVEVADLSRMRVTAAIDESDIAQVRLGSRVVVRLVAYGEREFSGVVDRIAVTGSYAGGRDAKVFRVDVLLDEIDEPIRPGLTAETWIETRRHEDVMKVPSQAVLARRVDELPGEIRRGSPDVDARRTFATVVYRVADGRAVVTPVTVGAADETHTVIVSGLADGESVIVEPYKVLESIEHDQRVRPEPAIDAAPPAR